MEGSASMLTRAKSSGQVRQVGKTSGPALKRYLGATVRTADRIDYWIRQHVIERPPGLAGHANELRSAEAQASAPAAAPTRASARRAAASEQADACLRSTRLALGPRPVAQGPIRRPGGPCPPAACRTRAATRGAGLNDLSLISSTVMFASLGSALLAIRSSDRAQRN